MDGPLCPSLHKSQFMNYMSIPTVQCGQVLGQAARGVTQKTSILHILWMEEWYHRTVIFSLYYNSMEHRSRALWSISYDTQVLFKPTLFIPKHAKFLSITSNILCFFSFVTSNPWIINPSRWHSNAILLLRLFHPERRRNGKFHPIFIWCADPPPHIFFILL